MLIDCQVIDCQFICQQQMSFKPRSFHEFRILVMKGLNESEAIDEFGCKWSVLVEFVRSDFDSEEIEYILGLMNENEKKTIGKQFNHAFSKIEWNGKKFVTVNRSSIGGFLANNMVRVQCLMIWSNVYDYFLFTIMMELLSFELRLQRITL
jgi:hypothetical protein